MLLISRAVKSILMTSQPLKTVILSFDCAKREDESNRSTAACEAQSCFCDHLSIEECTLTSRASTETSIVHLCERLEGTIV